MDNKKQRPQPFTWYPNPYRNNGNGMRWKAEETYLVEIEPDSFSESKFTAFHVIYVYSEMPDNYEGCDSEYLIYAFYYQDIEILDSNGEVICQEEIENPMQIIRFMLLEPVELADRHQTVESDELR